MKHDLAEVVKHFPIEGRFLDAAPYGTGHINDTYATRWETGGTTVRWLQQRINHAIFKEPLKVMENILRVTRHLRGKLLDIPGADARREALTVIPTRDGEPCWRDPDGNFWRTYAFIERATTYDVCETADQAAQAARAFGRFQKQLVDLPGGPLHETIPFFHHTPRRFQALEDAIARDAVNRCASAAPEIAFAQARKGQTAVVTRLLEEGSLPTRITHNDTKLNNVMMDDLTGRGICVIDLDTVMNGSVLYDFGDMVRTCTRTSAEDEPDLRKVRFREDMYEALVRGYLEEAGPFLSSVEVEHLAFSGALITFTIGIRFLADYLSGDVYFRTHRLAQNLERARIQFKMVEEMERRKEGMARTVRRYAGAA